MAAARRACSMTVSATAASCPRESDAGPCCWSCSLRWPPRRRVQRCAASTAVACTSESRASSAAFALTADCVTPRSHARRITAGSDAATTETGVAEGPVATPACCSSRSSQWRMNVALRPMPHLRTACSATALAWACPCSRSACRAHDCHAQHAAAMSALSSFSSARSRCVGRPFGVLLVRTRFSTAFTAAMRPRSRLTKTLLARSGLLMAPESSCACCCRSSTECGNGAVSALVASDRTASARSFRFAAAAWRARSSQHSWTSGKHASRCFRMNARRWLCATGGSPCFAASASSANTHAQARHCRTAACDIVPSGRTATPGRNIGSIAAHSFALSKYSDRARLNRSSSLDSSRMRWCARSDVSKAP
mmetsp:Transcript_54057/g.166311  ORF Transcript_54057/g.166311 Transcript_54057/m.166311 type:complete len:367 (-) Transcript_54057:1078-2178(-)